MKIVAAYGSVRSERKGIRAARWIVGQLERRGHEVTLFDALELELPLLDRMYKEYAEGEAPDPLPRMAEAIRAADAFVIVTGEYNHSLPPGLANLLDYFLEEWFWRPSAIVSYSAGAFGGVRAAVHLRAVLAELGMPAIPSELAVPKIGSAFDDAGEATDDRLPRRAGRFLDELEWYARAMARERAEGVPY